MWDSINVQTDEFMSLDFIFIDEEGSVMHAIAWPFLARKYRAKFREGFTYEISNFKVTASKQHRPVPGKYKIVFLSESKVIDYLDSGSLIPQYCYHFVDYGTIVKRQENYDQFSDVIGLLTGYGPIEYIGNSGTGRRKRVLELLLARDTFIRVILWGNIAERVDDEFLASVKDHLVTVFTTVVVKYFAGKRSLTSTCGTKILFDVNIPEAVRIKEQLCHTIAPGLKYFGSDRGANLPVQEQMFLNRKRIVEIKDILLNGQEGDKDVIVTCLATIKDFVRGAEWCFVSCIACNHKMMFEDGCFLCDCGNSENTPISRFKVTVRVADTDETSSFVLFDNEIERLFSTSATSLLRAQKNDCKTIPDRLLDLVGMTFVFQIKITSYNFTHLREDFTVIKTYKPVQTLEREYQISLRNKRDKTSVDDSPDSCLNVGPFMSPLELQNDGKRCPSAPVKKGSGSSSRVSTTEEDILVCSKRRKVKINDGGGTKLFIDDDVLSDEGTTQNGPGNGSLVQVTPKLKQKCHVGEAGIASGPAPVSDDESDGEEQYDKDC